MEQPHLHSNETERALAHQIVAEELGQDFRLNMDLYPNNKGLKGDEGVFGETVEIECFIQDPIRFLAEEQELLARVSNRLCNEVPTITKVLFMTVKADSEHQNLP